MNERIGIYMRVFRNEPGIHDAVKSVLAQTYSNWKFYVVVNDKTEEVIKSYAEADDRIEVIMRPAGEVLWMPYYLKKIVNDNNEYVCILDGDDTLSPDFLIKMHDFSLANKTDISFCGFNIHNHNNTISSRVLTSDYVWDIKDTNLYFIGMYQFFRATWGALYSSEVIEKYAIERCPAVDTYGKYGGDTIFVFNCLYYAKRCGFCNAPLYNYFLSNSGDTYLFEKGRLGSDNVLFNFVKDFLVTKSSFGPLENSALHLIYGYALLDTVRLVLKKVNDIYDDLYLLLSSTLTREAIELIPTYKNLPDYDDEKGNITRQLLITLSSNKAFTNLPVDKQYNLYELLGIRNDQLLSIDEYRLVSLLPNFISLYHFGDKEQTFNTLLNILTVSIKTNSNLCILSLLKRLSTSRIEDLMLTSEKCIYNNMDIYISLHNKDFSKVLQLIKTKYSASNDTEYYDELTQVWILCAATLEKGSDFILAKKIRSEFLAKHNRKDEALVELNDITDMGVNDQETEYLRSLIESI